jgi:hypothetical protein
MRCQGAQPHSQQTCFTAVSLNTGRLNTGRNHSRPRHNTICQMLRQSLKGLCTTSSPHCNTSTTPATSDPHVPSPCWAYTAQYVQGRQTRRPGGCATLQASNCLSGLHNQPVGGCEVVLWTGCAPKQASTGDCAERFVLSPQTTRDLDRCMATGVMLVDAKDNNQWYQPGSRDTPDRPLIPQHPVSRLLDTLCTKNITHMHGGRQFCLSAPRTTGSGLSQATAPLMAIAPESSMHAPGQASMSQQHADA